MMSRSSQLSVLVAILVGVSTSALGADDGRERKSLGKALKDGTYEIDLRYRFEHVSDDLFDEDGTASTLRTAVSYRSARFRDLDVTLELENVSDIGAGSRHDNAGFGSLSNGVTDRPVVADPELTEVHQVHLGYHGLPETSVWIGRQQFALGDDRFIGAVPWRQNYQSFDGVRIEQSSLPRTKLVYAFIGNANNIVGADLEQSSHLLHVEIDADRWGTVTPYLYELDFDSMTLAVLSTRTAGASWRGRGESGRWKLPYRLEWAVQHDVGDNPGNVDADYLRVVLGGERDAWSVQACYEVLEGSAADGQFRTPLATLHKFNGWADRFLVTPTNGLADLSLSVGYRRGAWSARLIYHDFRAESGGPDHGSEIDGIATWRSGWGQSFAFKFALFDADAAGAYRDTDKYFLYSSYKF